MTTDVHDTTKELEEEKKGNNAETTSSAEDSSNLQTDPISSTSNKEVPEYVIIENNVNLDFEDLPVASQTNISYENNPIVENLIYKGDLVLISCDPVIGSSWFLINIIAQVVDKNKVDQYFSSCDDIEVLYVNETLQYQQIVHRINKCTPTQFLSKITILSSKKLAENNSAHIIDFSKDYWRTFLLHGVLKSKANKLIVIDDFNLLCSTTKKIYEVSLWLKELKKFGATLIVLVKTKQWKRYIKEDIVDLELRLIPYETAEFLGFKMDIKRARNISKDHLKPMLFEVIEDSEMLRLTGKQYHEDITHKIAFYIANGYSQSEIAKLLGVNQSTVSRRFDQALNGSLLIKQGKQYILSTIGLTATKGMVLPDD